jgi:HKD family nuclease
MKISFLGQGFEETSKNSVGNYLGEFFADKEFNSFTGISAFTSLAGVNLLSKYISLSKKNLGVIKIVTGVDQKGTSKEALEALLDLNIDSFVFYAPPPFPIFHPKIYLFEGKVKSKLIVGSSNLTMSGLFSNIESSMLIHIDNRSKSDRKIIDQLKEYFNGIFKHNDPNLQKLTKQLIADLVNAKVVPTEAERKAAQEKIDKNQRKETQNIISKIFPRRAIAKIPSEFKGGIKSKEKSNISETTASSFIKSKASKLLWESGKLTERDLNIPKGSNTNPTGSMLFKKGKTLDIDQRHYFRDEVFSSLRWSKDGASATAHLERAKALFKIIIDGKDSGDFELTITHNTRTNTRSYEQNNSMTSISWGKAKKVIANDKLIGKSAILYKNKGKNDEFTLEIS